MAAEAVTRDRDRLRRAFDALRDRGFWSRSDQDGGIRAIPEDVIKRSGPFVLWHAHQTQTAFDEHDDVKSPLYLHHRYADADEILAVLMAHGLRVRLDGPADARAVVVDPQDQEPT